VKISSRNKGEVFNSIKTYIIIEISCNIHTFEGAIRILKDQRKYILISKLFVFLMDDADYM